jgi:hypothetical protein
MARLQTIEPGYRGSAGNVLPQAQPDAVFHPLQWVRARWNGDTMTGRVCCAIVDGSGDEMYEVELPELIGKGGTHVRVVRAANELEPALGALLA